MVWARHSFTSIVIFVLLAGNRFEQEAGTDSSRPFAHVSETLPTAMFDAERIKADTVILDCYPEAACPGLQPILTYFAGRRQSLR
jgi:hypothetical protein